MMADSEGLDAGQLATVLRDLRLSRSDAELKMAVDKIAADGPCDAITRACQEVDLAQSSHGTLATDVQLLIRGADLVAPADADRHARWALAALAAEEGLPKSTYSNVWMRRELVVLVRVLWRQLERELRRDVIRFLRDLPTVTDQSVAEALADLARRVPPEEWEESDLRRLKERVAVIDEDERDHEAIINGWRSVLLAGGDEQTRQDLMLEASQGSYDAVLAIGPFTELSPEAVRGFISSLRQAIAQHRQDAQTGTGNIGPDDGGTLLRLNVFFPDSADWEPVKWILDGPALPYHQVQLLETLEVLAHKLTDAERHMLIDSVRRLAAETTEAHPFLGIESVDRAAIKALHQLENPLGDCQTLANRLAGDQSARSSVADAIGRTGGEEHLQALISLSVDHDSKVRAATAEACVNWMLRGIATEMAKATLERLLDEGGRRISMHALRPIMEDHAQTIAWLIDRLESSPSSIVRSRVQELRRSANER